MEEGYDFDTNLLQETIGALEQNNKTPEDVRWVGSLDGKFAIDWAAFAAIADFNYDSSYGSQEIEPKLVVVGDDWWLERYEYDGSEWWSYNTLPIRVEQPQTFDRIKRGWRDEPIFGKEYE